MHDIQDDFKQRVTLAASYISTGQQSTRTFDSCFEMNDGYFVVTALYRRTIKNPDTKLAANIWKYLCEKSVKETAESNKDISDKELPQKALEARIQAHEKTLEWIRQQDTKNAA